MRVPANQGLGADGEALNRDFDFNPWDIDYLILSHAHIDHSGLIPYWVKNGFKGKIICTQATRDLCKIMLADTAHIQENDLRFINKRRLRKGEKPLKPLYDSTDVIDTILLMQGVDFNKPYTVCDGVELTFTFIGHILGSGCGNLKITENNKLTRFCFTGDIGRENGRLLKQPQAFPQADYIITESTYLPMILKLNNSDSLAKMDQPCSALTASAKDAVRLGCTAIGYTIYPGSGFRNTMVQDLRDLILEGKSYGLPTVLWAYPRGGGLSKDGETAIDVVAYAAQISAQLGAHVIKIKPPKDHLEQAEAKKVFEKFSIPTKTLTDRVRHCVQSAFNGKRIVIFSGGEAKGDAEVMAEVKELAAGGAFGSIMGRNAFQRPRADAIKLLHGVMDVFKSA